MSKQIFKKVIILHVLLLLSAACATETADRGVTFDSPDRETRVGTRRVNVVVELERDGKGKIPGVEIQASTPTDKDQDVTDKNGRAIVTLILSEDDGIDFFFRSKPQGIEWTRTVTRVPQGQTELEYLFKVDASGRVRLSEVAY